MFQTGNILSTLTAVIFGCFEGYESALREVRVEMQQSPEARARKRFVSIFGFRRSIAADY